MVATAPLIDAQVPAEISANLESSDWSDRDAGFEALFALPRSAEVETALIRLLIREDPIQTARRKAAAGCEGDGNEGYGNYFSALSETVTGIAEKDPARPDVWTALFGFPCIPRWPATYTEAMASCLLDVIGGAEAIESRGQAMERLGQITKGDLDPKYTGIKYLLPEQGLLHPKELAVIDRSITKGLKDRDPEVRFWASFHVAELGTLKDLPVLQKMARTDPAVRTDFDGKNEYWIRKNEPRNINILRARFTKQDYAERKQRYLAIKPEEKQKPEIEKELIGWLAQEDQEFDRARQQGFDAPAFYYDYFDYVNSLAVDVLNIADRNPGRADVWPALFGYPYVLPQWFAAHGDRAAPYFLAIADGRKAPAYDRTTAFEVLAETVAYERNSSTQHRLTPSELAAIENELRKRTKDADQKIKAAADGLQKRLAGETPPTNQ
jgi:hypothetical protein